MDTTQEKKCPMSEAKEYFDSAAKMCSGFPKELDEETLKVIGATAPVVVSHISKITAKFYTIMLEKYPITKTMFNPTHFIPEEISGKTPQSVALGEAIVKGCSFLGNLESLKDQAFLELSAQKHCCMGVLAQHYPIVYECFMDAVGVILGDVVTPEIAAAWSKVVLYQARAYIEREVDIYRGVVEQGGWIGFKNFVVSEIKNEVSEVTSYTFTPQDNVPLPDYIPGSYIAIRLNDVNGVSSHLRTYSLTTVSNKMSYSISVKQELGRTVTVDEKEVKTPDGVFSNIMKERLQVGTVVELSAAFGNFTLQKGHVESNKAFVFVAAGIGITPILSILKELERVEHKAPIYLLYLVRNSSFHAFDGTFKSLVEKFSNVKYLVSYSNPLAEDKEGEHYHISGFPTQERFKEFVGDDSIAANYYICGDPIIRKTVTFLQELNIPADQLHYEYFGPLGTGLA